MLARVDTAETDTRPRGSAPARLCALTREVRPVADMIRFVVGPDGVLVPDVKRKLPGRGVWVTARRDRLAEAVRRNVFRRALKREVKVPADLPATVERLLEQAALDALSIVHKARQLVLGFAKVEAAVVAGTAVAVLHARDAAPDGVRKITAAAKRLAGESAAGLPAIDCFSSTHLDLALGRPNVIHAALLPGHASDAFLARWRTLERFRTGDVGERDGGPPDQNARD